jgi:hypothetical protein
VAQPPPVAATAGLNSVIVKMVMIEYHGDVLLDAYFPEMTPGEEASHVRTAHSSG